MNAQQIQVTIISYSRYVGVEKIRSMAEKVTRKNIFAYLLSVLSHPGPVGLLCEYSCHHPLRVPYLMRTPCFCFLLYVFCENSGTTRTFCWWGWRRVPTCGPRPAQSSSSPRASTLGSSACRCDWCKSHCTTTIEELREAVQVSRCEAVLLFLLFFWWWWRPIKHFNVRGRVRVGLLTICCTVFHFEYDSTRCVVLVCRIDLYEYSHCPRKNVHFHSSGIILLLKSILRSWASAKYYTRTPHGKEHTRYTSVQQEQYDCTFWWSGRAPKKKSCWQADRAPLTDATVVNYSYTWYHL